MSEWAILKTQRPYGATPTMMTERDLAIADMEYARQSHLRWAEHLEAHVNTGVACPQCEAKPYKINDAPREREWVAKYDRVLGLLRRNNG